MAAHFIATKGSASRPAIVLLPRAPRQLDRKPGVGHEYSNASAKLEQGGGHWSQDQLAVTKYRAQRKSHDKSSGILNGPDELVCHMHYFELWC